MGKVREDHKTGMKNTFLKKSVAIYDLDSVLFFIQVGNQIAEFYASMYVLYSKNEDPAIGLTLTFTHNMVSANSDLSTLI